MRSVFIAFVVTALLLLTTTTVVGTLVDGRLYFDHHFALGLVTTLFLCLGHCVVFTYFMATNKMIQMAVEDAELDPALHQQARGCKRRAYRAVLIAVMMIVLAALTGGWVTERPSWVLLHSGLVALAEVAQLIAWSIEFHAIRDNTRLMDDVFEQHARKRGHHEVRHV